MMRKNLLLALLVLILGSAMKSDKPAYQFYNLKGKDSVYKDVLESALGADIVFFGELHDSPICHWLELELTKDLFSEKKQNLIIGAEMFETDNQLILNEYLSGKIKERNFEEEAKLWKNYKTDYKPLVKFALTNKIPFIATNIPRRYAALVNKSGLEALDSLSAEAKSFLPPLPIAYDPELKGYKGLVKMMADAGSHDTLNIGKAQAVKDATMAYSILKNWKQGVLLIHYNGSYHTDNFEGIIWYIHQAKPDLKILTISSVEQDGLDTLAQANEKLADYILCIPSSMTKTY
jgi:uncharacterized iron-regulated protein